MSEKENSSECIEQATKRKEVKKTRLSDALRQNLRRRKKNTKKKSSAV